MSPSSDQVHVIVGAGATGTATAKLLASDGARVKIVTRSGSGPELAGVERIAADASDQQRLTEITTGAAALYNCANPPYHQWATAWPPLSTSLLEAAAATGAVLTTLGNLYGYPKPTRPMSASDRLDAPSVKGGIRNQMWADALAAHDAGRVRVTEVRASDFIGPGVGQNGRLADRVVPRVLKGKSVSLLGNLDVAHSWTAIDDVAKMLVTAAQDERAWGRAWHVPTAAPRTQRQMVHHLCELAGVAPVKVSALPNALVYGLGIFMPMLRELREVAYQFEAPFVIDSQETTDIFGLEATQLDVTLQSTLRSYGLADESDVPVHR